MCKLNKNIVLILGCILCVLVFSTISEASEITEEEDNNTENIPTYVTEGHPRKDNLWIQYFPLTTALRKNVVISDIITPSSKWEDWSGNNIATHDMSDETAQNYDNSHNHYQNLLSEVLNFSAGTNAVAIWGDSSAVVHGSKAWGGFFSARSNLPQFVDNDIFAKYIPKDADVSYNSETYDAQLIGIEVDVLNDGLPGVYPNMSKTGVQIVGFGNANSMAIEVRSEDTDKLDIADEDRRGCFESGIYFKNSIAPYGRLVVSDLKTARIGLDLQNTLFSEGVMKLNSEQVGTGIILNNGNSGEIYGGKRWSETEDENGWLTLRAGNGGIRIVSNDNTKELVAIDNFGGIYVNGDVFVNGIKVSVYKTIIMVISIFCLFNFAVIFVCGVHFIALKYNQS